MRITCKQFAQTLYDLTEGKSNPEIEKIVADFGMHLKKGRKLKLMEKILDHFAKVWNKEKGIVEAEVVTAQKLEKTQASQVKKYIKEKYEAKEVVLKNIVDESVKGGIIIRIGDEVMDGSVKGRLEELRKIIT